LDRKISRETFWHKGFPKQTPAEPLSACQIKRPTQLNAAGEQGKQQQRLPALTQDQQS
jgi:hypothetical protein